jgi:hypothetical protein
MQADLEKIYFKPWVVRCAVILIANMCLGEKERSHLASIHRLALNDMACPAYSYPPSVHLDSSQLCVTSGK